MFTGLVREVGRLQGVRARGGVTRLDIEAPKISSSIGLGDSVAVNGICLTVVRIRNKVFTVEAVPETCRLTTLAKWRSGDRVHLEPALRAGDPMDGHLVQGHVDGTGKVMRITTVGGSRLLTIGLPRELTRFLTPKGSIAVDGVSLTVDEGPFKDRFTVSLIPHTLAETNFKQLRVGRLVNLELDVLVKAAQGRDGEEAAEARPATGLTLERLLARGFGRFGGSKRT
ncbi:MAG: riboflavin synthase [Gemmatimonadales bacterium]|nr:riboflavin synthase [Gemmatimonadales bacterium]